MKYCIGCKKKYPDNYSHCPICRETLLSFEEYLFYYQQLQWQQQQQQMQMYWQQTQRQQMQWQQQWQSMAQAQWQQMQQQQAQLQQIQQFQAQMMQYGIPQQEQRAIGAGNAMNQYGDSQYGYGYSNNGIQEAVYAPDMHRRNTEIYDSSNVYNSAYGTVSQPPDILMEYDESQKKQRKSLKEVISTSVQSIKQAVDKGAEKIKSKAQEAKKQEENEDGESSSLNIKGWIYLAWCVIVVVVIGYLLIDTHLILNDAPDFPNSSTSSKNEDDMTQFYYGCAFTAVMNECKYDVQMLNSELVSEDDYGRICVILNVQIQNGFGAYSNRTAYVVIWDLDIEEGTFSRGVNSVMIPENYGTGDDYWVNTIKTINHWNEPL